MNRIKLVAIMVIWGSLGVFTRLIPLSALNLAFLRALVALPVLLLVVKVNSLEDKRRLLKWSRLKPYIVSGLLLGIGWLTLFYGFKHTSIASAVILYNMCPVYVLIAAPVVLHESISKTQVVVILLSFIGLVFIVGENMTDGAGYLGMILSAVSGIMYATIVLINRGIKVRLDNRLATTVQVSMALLVLLPFVVADGSILKIVELNSLSVILVIILGVVHTGIAYSMFFSLYAHLESVEIVAYSYLEPLFAIIFGFLLIGERLTIYQVIEGLLIIGSTYLGEVYERSH